MGKLKHEMQSPGYVFFAGQRTTGTELFASCAI
jgi:hypothetical protein